MVRAGKRPSREVPVFLAVALLVSLTLAGCTVPEDSPREARGKGGLGFERNPSKHAECHVRGTSHTSHLHGESLVLTASVAITEAPAHERWVGTIAVVWGSWPERPSGLMNGPAGDTPGDAHATRTWVSKLGEAHRVEDELRLEWDPEDFELDGSYRGTVSLTMTKETIGVDGKWKKVCEKSGDARLHVKWED